MNRGKKSRMLKNNQSKGRQGVREKETKWARTIRRYKIRCQILKTFWYRKFKSYTKNEQNSIISLMYPSP